MRAWWATAFPVAAVVAVDPGGLSPFGPAKWLVVPALVLVGLAAAWWRGAASPGRPWLVLLAVVSVAAALGDDRLHAWVGTHERRFGALTWALCAAAFVVGRSLTPVERRRLAQAAAVTAGVVGAWALAEVLGWEPIELTGAGDRPVGPLGSSAYLGAAAVLLTPVAVGLAAEHRHRWWWGAAGLGAVALVASGARAAWLGAVVAAAAVAIARRRVPWGAAGAAAVGLLALAAVTGVAGRVPDALTDDDGGLRGRLDEWRVAVQVVAAHPLVGVGPEGYRIDFGAHVDDAYEQDHGRWPLPDRAHSAPLDVAATLGLPGVAAWIAVLVAAGRPVVRTLGASPAGAGVAAGLVAYAVQSLLLFPLAELDPVAWCLAGTLAPAAARRGARPLAVAAGALAAASVVAGVAGIVADRRAVAALEGTAAPDAALRLRPDVVAYHLVEARVTGDPAAAEDALDLSPRDPVARAEHARLLLDTDPDAALPVLEELVADDPRNAEALLRLGVARIRTGDVDGAIAAWQEAERLAPDSTAATENIARARRDGT